MRTIKRRLLLGGLFSISLVLLFQNCGQPGSVSLNTADLQNQIQQNAPEDQSEPPQYAVQKIGMSQPPPLKLFFILDNSNSMTLSHLNLQKSIGSMFSSDGQSLSEFDSQIYFITTAQLSSLASGFLGKLKDPLSLGSNLSPSFISAERKADVVSGVIAGDVLGFKLKNTSGSDYQKTEYLPQTTVGFVSGGNQIQVQPQVTYLKGTSLEVLQSQVNERLEVLSPSKASNIQDASLFSILDKESGMCALSRILHYPNGMLNPGDLASFVIVSDENEADPLGAQCLSDYTKQFLYGAVCKKVTPAYLKNQTRVTYQTSPKDPFQRTVLTLTSNDLILKKKLSTAKLSRAAVATTCAGTYEKDFNVKFDVEQPQYSISYEKWNKLGDREGGVVVYSTTSTTSKVTVKGTPSSDCLTNLTRLQGALSNTVDKLTILSCQVEPLLKTSKTAALSYSSYPSFQVGVGQTVVCSESIIQNLSAQNLGLGITNCIASTKTDVLPGAWLSSVTSNPAASVADCSDAVNLICSSSQNNFRNCLVSSFKPSVAADSKGPVSVLNNMSLDCNATCGQFSGLCSVGSDALKLNDFAKSIGYSCSVSVSDSAETYIQPQVAKDFTFDGSNPYSCSSLCSALPSACAGLTTAGLTLESANKSCLVKSVTAMPATASATVDLGIVDDISSSITCSALCSAASKFCPGANAMQLSTLTIENFLKSAKGSIGCQSQTLQTPVAEAITRQNVTKLTAQQLNDQSCPQGFLLESSSITSDFKEINRSIPGANGKQDLSQHILDGLRDQIGQNGATLSAFITLKGQESGATSYGQLYEQLVQSFGRGSVHNVKEESYIAALTHLGKVVKDQVHRSLVFNEVPQGYKITKVWRRAGAGALTDWGNEIDSSKWSASGGTVTLDSSFDIQPRDEFQIEFVKQK